MITGPSDLYVALTRAKEGLNVYFPLRSYSGRGDRHSFSQLTRFLTPEARALMKQEVVYDHQDQQEGPTADLTGSASVDRLLESLLED